MSHTDRIGTEKRGVSKGKAGKRCERYGEIRRKNGKEEYSKRKDMKGKRQMNVQKMKDGKSEGRKKMQ